MKPFLIYTALRIGLFLATMFVVSAVVIGVFGDSPQPWIWSLVAAAVISSILSLRLLEGPRERFAEVINTRARKATAAMEAARSREDVD